MTKEELLKLKDGDIVYHKQTNDEMRFMWYDYFVKDIHYPCFSTNKSIYPYDEFNLDEWETKKSNKKICCICGNEFEGYGNNPYPLFDDENSKCCDNCNFKFVIPARLVNARDGELTINPTNAPDFIYACATTISKEK